jgi:hypothetical protein
MNHLRISSWNANGVKNKRGELINFIYNHKLDVVLVNETKLTATDRLKIRNYTCLRKDRLHAAGGGVAIFIKNDVVYSKINLHYSISIECIGIRLENNVHIIAAYNSPSNSISNSDIDKLLRIGDKVLVIGDLNARHTTWNCHLNNANGTTLYNYTINNNCEIIHTSEHTHFPLNNGTPTTIDIIINKNVCNFTHPQALSELNSDHNPILFTINMPPQTKLTKKVYDYTNTNWTSFQNALNNNIEINSKIESPNDINTEINKFTSTIQNTIHNLIKTKTLKPKQEQLPENIINLIRNKNKTRKLWQNTRNPFYKTLMNSQIKEIKKSIAIHRQKAWADKLQNLNTNDNSLWRMSRSLKKEYKTIPTLIENNDEYMTTSQKANILADKFQEVHNTHANLLTPEQTEIKAHVTGLNLNNNLKPNWYKYATNPNEITDIIRKLPPTKAPGPDKIQNIILKHLPKKAIVQLMYIINATIKYSYFPIQWKLADVIPILKPGKIDTNPASYRPISLLPTLSKLTEKIILIRIKTFELNNNIIIDNQFGFRNKHNTVQQITRLVNDITINFNKNNVTGMILLDIEKAFDRVWLDGLIYKMYMFNYPNTLIHYIHSYLNNRQFQVVINEYRSGKRSTLAGVPQGSVLGPALFNIFLNDIPEFPKTKLALFADDTAIYAHSFSAVVAAKQIQIHIDILVEYYKKWKITLNSSKSEYITFKRKFTNTRIFQPIKIDNSPIEIKHSVKYLGIHLDEKLTFKTHIKESIRKGHASLKNLYSLMVKNSKLCTNNKRLIYKVIIRPILTYAAPAWSSASNTNIKLLQRFQNKILRLILNGDRYSRILDLHNESSIPYIHDYILQQAAKFYDNQLNSNRLTRTITDIRQHNAPFRIRHKLPYQNLAIFNRQD